MIPTPDSTKAAMTGAAAGSPVITAATTPAPAPARHPAIHRGRRYSVAATPRTPSHASPPGGRSLSATTTAPPPSPGAGLGAARGPSRHSNLTATHLPDSSRRLRRASGDRTATRGSAERLPARAAIGRDCCPPSGNGSSGSYWPGPSALVDRPAGRERGSTSSSPTSSSMPSCGCSAAAVAPKLRARHQAETSRQLARGNVEADLVRSCLQGRLIGGGR